MPTATGLSLVYAVPTRVEQYRVQAKESAERAKLAPEPDTKRYYEEIERQWLDLAKRADEDGGWSPVDAVDLTFITGLTISYSDLVPRQTLTRVLAIGIGFCGLLLTGLAAAIAVHAMRSTLTDGGNDGERS